MKINIASNELIHFIGIGGIGMSGLAQIMANMGFQIQGSDLNNNKNIDRLVKSGIKTFIGHNKKNIKKATMVVISSAIKKNNKELIASKNKKLSIFMCAFHWVKSVVTIPVIISYCFVIVYTNIIKLH